MGVVVPLRAGRSTAEPYRTRREIARSLGVSERTVDRMRRAGCPSVVFGGRSRRYLLSEVVAFAATWKGAA